VFEELKEILQNQKINITENDVLEYLQITNRWPYRYPWGQASVEIISNINHKKDTYFFNVKGEFIYEKWKELYDKGFTTIISNILDLHPDLRKIKKEFFNILGINVCGNFYFSKVGQKPSFDSHLHDYDVLVKQIYGESEWNIKDQKNIVKPNDVIILPKGTLHSVIGKTTNKLSLTINIE
jgi:mannose-6-phosphate isomerase-like protein (cupin superfamily)